MFPFPTAQNTAGPYHHPNILDYKPCLAKHSLTDDAADDDDEEDEDDNDDDYNDNDLVFYISFNIT